MGVSSILLWPPLEGYNPTQAVELLQKKVELLGGKNMGSWSVECETLQSTQTFTAGGPQKLVHMLHSSEYPRTTFAVLDSMNCIVADNSLDTIFMNLRPFYAPSARKGSKIWVKGYIYEVRSYAVKFGPIVMDSTNKVIVVVVETEDQGNDSVAQSWEKLTGFIKGLLDYPNVISPPQFSTNSNRPYNASDSMIHYSYIFTELRKWKAAATSGSTPTK